MLGIDWKFVLNWWGPVLLLCGIVLACSALISLMDRRTRWIFVAGLGVYCLGEVLLEISSRV